MPEPETKQFLVCHAREVRTFFTVQAVDKEQAMKRAEEALSIGGGTPGEPPLEWLDGVEIDESDPGELEFREEL